MGHKIHPSGLRLGITQEHRSKWFATSKTYPILLQEDFKIRTFIQKKYGAAGISDVLIARKADQLELELKTARPGVIVGRQGSGIEELRSGIQKTIGDRTRQVRINVVEVTRQGPASIRVTGTELPLSSKSWDMPNFFPKIPIDIRLN